VCFGVGLELVAGDQWPKQELSSMHCRFLYLVGQLAPGGLERQLCYLLQGMDRKRYRPAVVVWNFSEVDVLAATIRALNVPLYTFANMPSAAAKLKAFRRLVRQFEPEVVHSYSFYTNFAVYWGTWGTHSKPIGSIRCDFRFEMKSTGPCLGRLSARWPPDQICNSLLAAETARRWHGPFVPRQLFVVRNGLDLEQFRKPPPLTPGDKTCIVGVGSLEPRKRWDRLLRAARELKRRGYDFQVRIVGTGSLRESLTHQAQTLGVDDRVELVGYSGDIRSVLTNANFMVHTSDSEGYPNVIMEAMACGRPVVATDAGDVPVLIEDGKTGFVVPRGDDATLLARIVTLMTDPDLCQRMGEASRAQAERQFGLDRLVSETLAAYRAAGWTSS
jgi:glycosyltransferase involved in cell wall biosynthesis